MDYLKRASELFENTKEYRRCLHKMPEIDLNTQQTTDYIIEQLTNMGYHPQRCGAGVVATVGISGHKTILLRADIDALPMKEESGLDFASTNGNAHSCGHDLHCAMLLGAAKMLKENEANLKGMVKLMFQPGEETFRGSKDMVADGLLENPKPDVCLAFHVSSGNMPIGMILYNDSTTMMNSSDNFTITITGKGSHGAYPDQGVDPINIAAHTILALESIVAREVNSNQSNVLTIGKIEAGDAGNIIPNEAKMYGTLRCDDAKQREFILNRLSEVCELTAKTYRGQANVTITSGTPPLVCDSQATKDFISYIDELDCDHSREFNGIHAGASDDLAVILSQIPGTYMYISAGFEDGRQTYAQHHPKVVFNEEVLKLGPAYYAQCATRWLEQHQ